MKLVEKLGNRDRRKVANNTYLERREGGAVVLKLHATEILTEAENGELTVRTGGWQSHTTKDRLNSFLPNGAKIWQERSQWFWPGKVPFTEGDIVTAAGEVKPQAKPGDGEKQRKLNRRILAFAKLCADSIPLPTPSGGDCWHCCMITQGGQSLGDATKDTSHLESHMLEKYAVPSLVFHALKEAGNTDMVISGAFSKESDWLIGIAKERTSRAVAKYMRRRFGLPA